MAKFCIEDGATKAKATMAVEAIDEIINAMKSAEYYINSAIETINNDDELNNLYFESKESFYNKLKEERLSFLRFGDICFEYDQEVNAPFMKEYEKVVDLISDIKCEEITIQNNIGATETEYYTDNQYGGRDIKSKTKIKETIGFQDVLTYGPIGDLIKANYENYCTAVEGGKETYPEFENYLNGLITKGEFDYDIPTPWKEYLSIAIDCIPIIGDGKSLIEAVIGVDLITGRDLSNLERAFCLAAIIPLVGDTVKIGGKGTKLAMKSFGEELLKNVAIMTGTSGLSNIGINPVLCMSIYAGGKGTKGAINLLKNSDVLKKFEIPKRQVLNTIGFKRDEVKKFIENTKIVNGEYHVTLKQKIEGVTRIIFKDSDLTPMQKFGCTIGCFTEETLVITENGLKQISLIVKGEKVLTKNENTGELTYEKAELVIKQGTNIITLTVGNEIINTTTEHPFMTECGWVQASNLKVGSRILDRNNFYQVVENVEIKRYNYVKTYNLTVQNNHNFFITELGLMVHNIDCKNVKLSEIYKNFGEKITDSNIKKEFDTLISKLDNITETKKIDEYINKFDSKFKGIEPKDIDEIKKIIDEGHGSVDKLIKEIGNHISSDDLISSALELQGKKNTSVGRAFQKHSIREGSAFTGEITGNPTKNTNQGLDYLNKILNNKEATRTIRNNKAYGDILDVRLPDGMGARWTADGKKFIGFLERYTDQ
ncbi:MAG: polymorphic toxin-type HINT domain-containing protein [Clostridium sp.]